MKTIQIREITTQSQPAILNDEGEILQTEIPEVSNVHEENGFRYEEALTLESIEKEKNEIILRDKNKKKIPTKWEEISHEEKENRWFGLRRNAYETECKRLKELYPDRFFVVRIVET